MNHSDHFKASLKKHITTRVWWPAVQIIRKNISGILKETNESKESWKSCKMLLKSIKTIQEEKITRAGFVSCCCTVVIRKVHTSLSRQTQTFIYSLIHLIRFKCCSTSEQSALVQFEPCCLSWRVSTKQTLKTITMETHSAWHEKC